MERMTRPIGRALQAGFLVAGSTAAIGAQAQSSVTLYGVVDAYLDYSNHNAPAVPGQGGDHSTLRLTSSGLSGSRWGLRGVEDLGGGTKAVFALESGFNTDNGTLVDSRLFTRQAFVGLSGKFGQLTVGRQYTTLFDNLFGLTPLIYAGVYEPFMVMLGPLRADNSIKYRIERDGLSAQAHYGFGEQPGAPQGGAAWGGGMSYQSGAVGVTAVYDQLNGLQAAAGYGKQQKAALAGTLSLGDARLSAGYRWARGTDATGATANRDDMWWAGVNYALTPAFQLSAAFYFDDVKRAAGGSAASSPKQYVLQGIYSLSKRTDAYAAIGYVSGGSLNFVAPQSLAPGKSNQTGAALGLRQKF